MIEKLVSLTLPPGLYQNGTVYEAKGRWNDGRLVRWVGKSLRPVGGWTNLPGYSGAASGNPSNILTYDAAGLGGRGVIGTSTKLYGWNTSLGSETPHEITPGGHTTSLGPWQFDVMNGTLVAQHAGDYTLYSWGGDTSVGAAAISGYPSQVLGGVVVTPESFLVALGASSNNRRVAWASQGTLTTWTPATTNTAGSFDLQSKGNLLAGRKSKGQTLLWTDTDMWSMNYVGGTLIYGFRQESDSSGIIGPNAVAMVDGRAYWMGKQGFYMYDGFVRPIPCEVHDKVFSEIYVSSSDHHFQTCFAWANAAFNEVWWMYPTASGPGSPKFVIYNYRDNHWSIGSFPNDSGRMAAYYSPLYDAPIMVGAGGSLFQHETGDDRGSSPNTVFIASGPIELGDGDQVVRIQRIVPDEKTLGDTEISILASMSPTGAETTYGPFSLSQPTDVRITARQIRLVIAESGGATASPWRVGTIKLGVIPGGRR